MNYAAVYTHTLFDLHFIFPRQHRKSHGKLGFAELARLTASAWKSLDKDAKAVFEERAAIEKEEYKQALKVWSASIKKSSSPADNALTTPSLDYSPIPLRPPKPVFSQRQFASEGLRDDFHYVRSQDVQSACMPVHEPAFQDCNQSSSYAGSGRGVTFAAGNPHFSSSSTTRPAILPPNETPYSSDLDFCTSAGYDSGHGNHAQAYRRQSTSVYKMTNEAPTSHCQAQYRRQSTPDYSTRPPPVDSLQIRTLENEGFPNTAPNGQTSYPGARLERDHLSRVYSNAHRAVESSLNWSEEFVRPGHQTLPLMNAPQQHRSTHLPFRRSLRGHRGEGRYPGPELQGVIAAAAEGPETPEEEEEMNRLLRSYEC